MSCHKTRGLLLASLVSASLLTMTASAQQSAPASTDDLVMMSPFEVNSEKDYGYQAVNTLAGGRIETDLKDTPASISVMTREMLDDLGISNTQDSALWSVSSEASDVGTGFSDDFTISTRGLGNNIFGSRNYFRFYGNSDSYNTERIEFSRGPNALLFGESTLGGVTSTMTKQARLNYRIATLTLRADSNGSFRSTIDYNYSKNRFFGIRLNALYENSEGWREVTGQWQKDVHVATTISLAKNTQLRAEYQHSEKERNAPYNSLIDAVSAWNEDPSNINGAGTTAMASADILVWNAARPEDGILNWNGARRTTGSGLYMSTIPRGEIARFPAAPSQKFNPNDPGSTGLFEIDTATIYLDQKIGKKLFIQLAYNFTRPLKTIEEIRWNTMYIDLNANLPNGKPNPYHLQPYGEASLAGRLQSNEVHEYRFMGAWSFENNWMKQSFTVLASHRIDKYEYQQRRYVPNGVKSMSGFEETLYSSNNANDALRIRRYWSDLDLSERPMSVTNDYGTFPFEYREWNTNSEKGLSKGIQLSNVGKYFSGRLAVIAGYRYDDYQKDSERTASSDVTDPNDPSKIIPARNPDGTTNRPVPTSDPKSKAHSPSIGAVYWLGWGFALSANYSKNFRPATNGAPDIYGNSVGITTGQGIDIGIRYEFGAKVYGSLNYYDSKSYASATAPANDATIANNINNIWTQIGSSNRVITDFRDNADTTGTGWELELNYRPTKNWQMRATANLPYAEQYKVWPIVKGYVADNRAEWEAFINDDSQDPEARHTASTNLMDLDRIFATDAAEGVRRSSSVQWKSNFLTSYRFSTGELKGLTIGGGINYTGKRLIGRRSADKSIVWNQDVLSCSAFLKYELRVATKPVSLQLNIDNLLNNDRLDYLSITELNGLVYYNRYNYPMPRRFSLTATIKL